MRNHTWMHAGLLTAILAVFGLGALGVAVPSAVIYLIVLACPLMMVFMMFGMNHGHEPDGPGGADDGVHDRQEGLPNQATASGRTGSRSPTPDRG
jgi:hypothetical protein